LFEPFGLTFYNMAQYEQINGKMKIMHDLGRCSSGYPKYKFLPDIRKEKLTHPNIC
jgi:hypothetical protein